MVTRVTLPLDQGAEGPEVGNLQDALAIFLIMDVIRPEDLESLLKGLRRERAGQAYGDTTITLVGLFQGQRGLDRTGRVDERTAEEMNRALRELGLLCQGESERSRIVTGQVSRSNEEPFSGVAVKAFHVGDEGTFRMGEDATDDEGRYTIRYQALPGLEGIKLQVSAYDQAGKLLKSSEVIQAKPVETVNIDLPVSSSPPGERRLEGRVVFDSGLPAVGLELRLYSLDFGGTKTLLDHESTHELGLYALKIGPGVTGVVVNAVADGGEEIPLSRPMHDLGDAERIIVNLVAPADVKPMDAEYRRLAKDIRPHVREMKFLAGAKEDEDVQDLTFLNRTTGWDARLIALAANAEKLSADPEVRIGPEAMYGLLRAGMPSDKLHLSQVSPDDVEKALVAASRSGIVSLNPEKVAEAKDQFRRFAGKKILTLQAPGSLSTYGELLKASGLDENIQGKFAAAYLEHPEGEDLWKSARKEGLSDGQIKKLQLQGKFAFLTGNSGKMTGVLQNEIEDPSDLAEKDYFMASTWEAKMRVAAGIGDAPLGNLSGEEEKRLGALIPISYEGETLEERLRAYTGDLARKVRLSYPTQVIGRMVEKDADGGLRLGDAQVSTARLLKNAAAKGFRLGQTPVEAFFKSNPEVLQGIEGSIAAKENVKSLQRVYQMTPSNDSIHVLMEAGLTSAFDVVAHSMDGFVELYGCKFPSKEEAVLVYSKAQQVASVTYNLFTIAKKLVSDAPIHGVSSPVEVRDRARDELIKLFPTMESLFGSMDFCDCEHCRSVLSPAAYLVDLLQFIDIEPTEWDGFLALWKKEHGQDYPHKDKDGKPLKPYQVLIERRPDIPNIQLTCENTNTALPYIDLVNEILEYYVAYEGLTDDAAHDTGDATTPQLLAEPQNVISEAYDRLDDALYPLNLPFDLWIETVRQFCDYFKTPLWKLLEIFRPSDDLFAQDRPYDRRSVFIESLGLSPAEYAIFTDPDPLKDDKWEELYGYTDSRPVIGNSTNDENATLTISDGSGFQEGDICRYFSILDGAISDESMRIRSVSISGGLATIKFVGIWTKKPEDGDLLVLDVLSTLKSAKALSRRLGVTYREIAEIVETGFVNPKISDLLILYKAGLTVRDVVFYKEHKEFFDENRDLLDKERPDLSAEDKKRFDALSVEDWKNLREVEAFEKRLDDLTGRYPSSGIDLLAWLDEKVEDGVLKRVLVLADPDAGCSFDLTTLQYASGDMADPVVFLKINLFVRLWRKLGWTIEETDRALTTFISADSPFDSSPDHLRIMPLRTALIYIAHLKAIDGQLAIGRQSRLKLLALWSNLASTGKSPLYAQLFLNRSVIKSSEVFDDIAGNHLSIFDDPLGQYLSKAGLMAISEGFWHDVRKEGVTDADRIDPDDFPGEEKLRLRYDALEKVQYLSYLGVLKDEDMARLETLSSSNTLMPLLEMVQAKAKDFSLIKGHLPVLQGALGLTSDEIERILDDAGLDRAELSLENVSLLYRYGLLARALDLSIRDLIALKQLSGLDPFKPLSDAPENIQEDIPFSQTLAFIEKARQVEETGLDVEDLDFLLRHSFDPTGRYRQDSAAIQSLIREISLGIASIRAEHAVPADPGEILDEVLRQKLGLSMPSDIAERFMAMMNGTIEFTASLTGVQAGKSLKPGDIEGEPAIRQVSYRGGPGEQKLTFRGVLLDDQKAGLMARVELDDGRRETLSGLLDGVIAKAREFHELYLKKQDSGYGFLDDPDFKLLFEPMPSDPGAREKKIREKKARLALAFFPFLQERLVRQLIIQKIVAHTGSDQAIVEALISSSKIQVGSEPLLKAFAAPGQRGLDAVFFDSVGGKIGSDVFDDADTSQKGKNRKPPGTDGALLEGYLTVEAPGEYCFHAAFDRKDVKVEMSFDHIPGQFIAGTASEADGSISEISRCVELAPGTLYGFTLRFSSLRGGDARLLVQSVTLPKGSLSRLALYPDQAVEIARHARILLGKALLIVQRLDLRVREVVYLLTHPSDFDGLDLSNLPAVDEEMEIESIARREVEANPALTMDESLKSARTALSSRSRDLFRQFMRLAGYSRLKRDLASGTDDLIGVFEARDTDVYPLIARLTRRDESAVRATASAIFGEGPGFTDELKIQRLWDGLVVVQLFGVPVQSILFWTGIVSPATIPERRFAIARDVKESVKARFDQETWLGVARPIFDRLRVRSRDSLVAYIMHMHDFSMMEQLYEHFLIDPGMEPVVQTSRIRLAISTLQLFIQRCLINLEKDVSPSVIDSKQWEWMKRYRVWEANRKIFLFPENWLEPEFRDDKTHIFRELEGSLLQGDVSNDLVEDAFLAYLQKLEALASLDIVAMHIEDNSRPTQRVLHIIGRSYSSPHRYFYRRYSHSMWTAWEPVTADIGGDHLAPVVWRDRLYLFWVTFMERPKKPEASGSLESKAFESVKDIGGGMWSTEMKSGSSVTLPSFVKGGSKKKALAEMTLAEITDSSVSGGERKTIEAHLHWIEYAKGQWSSPESGEMSSISPVSIFTTSDFDSSSVSIHVSKEALKDEEGGVLIHLGGAFNRAFYLASRNSVPEYGEYQARPDIYPSTTSVLATRRQGMGDLAVSFKQRITTEDGKTASEPSKTISILGQGGRYLLLQCNNDITIGGPAEEMLDTSNPDAVADAIKRGLPEIAALMKPLFYRDRAHTFFIEPDVEERTIEAWKDWVAPAPRPEPRVIPTDDKWKEYVKPRVPKVKLPVPVDPGDPVWKEPFEKESIYPAQSGQDWLINPSTAYMFNGEAIGPDGRAGLAVIPSAKVADAIAGGSVVVSIASGSEVEQGIAVVAKASMAESGRAVSIVGGSGFNSALAKNFNALKSVRL